MVVITSVFLGLLQFVALASARATARSGMVIRASKELPEGFAHQGAAPADQTIPLRIALKQADIAGLEAKLYDVSTPGSANYGNHLSKEEVEEFVKPAQASVDAVNAYLSSNGINATTVSPAGDWLGFSVPVSKANELFDADFSVFSHVATGKEQIRTLSYSIPSALNEHVDLVHPTTNFIKGNAQLPVISSPLKVNGTAVQPNSPQPAIGAAVPAACKSTITPACLEALYGIPTTAATQSSNKLYVAGFLDQYAQKADLTKYLKALRPDLSSTTTFALDTIDGGSNPQGSSDAGIEANLDIQYTVGVAQGVPVTFLSCGDDSNDGWDGFLDMINHLLALTTPPQVLTTSYAFDETGLDPAASNTLCNAYMQLGARGTSIFFASGDGGVSGGQSQSCTKFIPTFPSTCPYVTSVGGTVYGTSETAASLSGGGFSNIFKPPTYQSSVVASYIKGLGTTYSGKYNASGRGVPDIAAIAENVEIYNAGSAESVAGTSCATPISASLVSLINDDLIAAGKSPLGFINPFLYANPSAFTDITSGTNPGCSTNGFSAKAGWDPVTGLGSPVFSKIKTAAGL